MNTPFWKHLSPIKTHLAKYSTENKINPQNDPNHPFNRILSRKVESKWLYVIFFSGIAFIGFVPLLKQRFENHNKKVTVIYLFGDPNQKDKKEDEKYIKCYLFIA